jgi:hypothetical protein
MVLPVPVGAVAITSMFDRINGIIVCCIEVK